jgi:hypothetical protein
MAVETLVEYIYGLLVDSKDYGSEFNIETPEQEKAELDFVRKLQNSYFNSPALSYDN